MKNYTRVLVSLPFILWGVQAQAQGYWLDIHIGSKHINANLNEQNFGLGITIPSPRSSNVSAKFGFYNNSYNDMSYYGGLDMHTVNTNGFGSGVLTGIVTGYQNAPDGAKVAAAIVPHLNYAYNGFKVELGFLFTKPAPAVTLSIGKSF